MKNNKLKALIIGYGSIGKRHDEVLSSLDMIDTVDLVTKQDIQGKNCYKDLQSVPNLFDYDYFLIASETSRHFEQLAYLEKNIENKTIFCEKPLFDSVLDLPISRNTVYVGYVLRFHPLLQALKSYLTNQEVLYVNIRCGQYLPTWRPDNDYRKCYSAKKSLGGGVLLDLSHEIDYLYWLLGAITIDFSMQAKVSDLEIDSDDLTFFCGRSQGGAVFNVSLDYLSKVPYRLISLHTNERSYEIDFIDNSITTVGKDGLKSKTIYNGYYRNYIYEQMHLSIMTDKKHVSDFNDGMFVMKIIKDIQEKSI